MQRSYLDYAMSVIVGARAARRPRRPQAGAPPGALRDVRRRLPARPRLLQVRARRRRRDGPVPPARRHARSTTPSSGWPSRGRCATRWSTARATSARRATTPPRRMRYTECRLAPLAMEMVRDIDEETVDFSPNYDGRTQEPDRPAQPVPEPARQRLGRHRGRHGHQHPAAQPARGRHRRAVAAGAPARPTARSCSSALIERIKGPDFPTGGADRRPPRASRTPTAPAAARSRCARSSRSRRSSGRTCLVVTELPYQVNPDNLALKIADLVKDGKVAGIADIRDEGIGAHRPAPGHRAQARRRREGRAQQPLQAHPAAGHLRREHARARRRRAAHAAARRVRPALGRPTRSRSSSGAPRYRLRKAEERAHILRGLRQGARRARRGHRADPRVARRSTRRAAGLMAAARDRRGAGHRDPRHAAAPAGRPGAAEDHRRAGRARAADRRAARTSSPARSGSGRSSSDELAEIVEKYGDERRTQIIAADGDMSMEDLIAEEDVVVTITRGGYAKRTKVGPLPLAAPRRQGRARRGAARGRHRRALLRHDDPPLDPVLHQQGPRLPGQGVRAARGGPRRPGPARGQPARVPARRADRPGPRPPRLRRRRRTSCSPRGTAWSRRRASPSTTRNRSGGVIAINLRDDDELIAARLAGEADDLLLVSPQGPVDPLHRRRRRAAADGPGHVRASSACGSATATSCSRWTSCATAARSCSR